MNAPSLIERLRHKARKASEIARQMAEAKSLRQPGHNPPRNDLYMWPKPEDTDEWKAADRIQSLEAALAEARDEIINLSQTRASGCDDELMDRIDAALAGGKPQKDETI